MLNIFQDCLTMLLTFCLAYRFSNSKSNSQAWTKTAPRFHQHPFISNQYSGLPDQQFCFRRFLVFLQTYLFKIKRLCETVCSSSTKSTSTIVKPYGLIHSLFLYPRISCQYHQNSYFGFKLHLPIREV